LYGSCIMAIPLPKRGNDGVNNCLHDKPHIPIKLWALRFQHDLWYLPELILVLVCLKLELFPHDLNFFDHHLAPLAAKERERVDLWENLLADFFGWGAAQFLDAFVCPIFGDQRQRLLHRLVGWLMDHPVRLH
ncbi:MAG TPA: hypothetical protein DEO86_19060, partial [Colwellia sp.]|nr:hypothetical protein [Colwellia sp.]